MESRDQEIIEQITEEAEQVSASLVTPESKNRNPFKSPFFTKTVWGIIIAFLISAVIYIISRFSPEFAEFWTKYPAQAIRFILAKITDIIPFSIAECLIILLPIGAILYIIASSVATKKNTSTEYYYKWIRPLISILLVIATLFFAGFGPAYGRKTLGDNLGLTRSDVSADELYETGIILSELIAEEIPNIQFSASGESVMPYDYATLTEKVNEAFDKYASDADYISHFSSKPKAIALSSFMTYTHISGVYTFMTGEANINTNYPQFLMPFTMAHEMAHQRGIAREDEANFVAFLVCIGSDDSYLRYSGYANMINYITDAIFEADLEKGAMLYYYSVPLEVRYEFRQYSLFFDKYRDSTASEVSGAINNTFLQSQGQKEGTKSYGLVVDLAVAYYK